MKVETEQLLEEFRSYNPNIAFEFIDPLESENPEALQQEFLSRGMKGAQVEVRENGKVSTEIVYPWALANYQEKTIKIPLLKNTLGATPEEREQFHSKSGICIYQWFPSTRKPQKQTHSSFKRKWRVGRSLCGGSF